MQTDADLLARLPDTARHRMLVLFRPALSAHARHAPGCALERWWLERRCEQAWGAWSCPTASERPDSPAITRKAVAGVG
ncbi:hypothetical protein J5X84_15735 [Streptosporangiaceae bacterium NEAU-GS5]|nr:hypothetical protein [Streptosporangiaceae bacterium NEAU-GS5]